MPVSPLLFALNSADKQARFLCMQYISTRGGSEAVGFKDAVLTGLARDGGLLLPESIPDARGLLEAWSGLSYPELACEIMSLYTDIPLDRMSELVKRSYAGFRHDEIAPVVSVGGIFILELFHGPTLAFKDIALQYLGNLFQHILEERDGHLNILAATSGDTGSAAIHGVRGRENISIFVMHPNGKISLIQERQMTSVLDKNVFNIAVEGTFDDCQRIMKGVFSDLDFRDRHVLGSVNSINWARLLAQIVYYFYSAFRVMRRTGAERVRFAVPTGNFGDILAGYLAWKMGLPVGGLILATNENDILARFFNTGTYSLGRVCSTISPSMDIQVASNFERYLYYRTGEDPWKLAELMRTFSETGSMTIACGSHETVDPLFLAGSGNHDSTVATIKHYYTEHGYLLDPHSAVGVHVASSFSASDEPMICLATAHPAKFPEAIKEAAGVDAARHPVVDNLSDCRTRKKILAADEVSVKEYIHENT